MRSPRGPLAIFGLLLLVAAACGGSSGVDEAAFCDLVSRGVGIDPESSADDLDDLLGAAPDDIEETVQKLVNSANTLEEIPDTDLDALFAAAFDPAALTARRDLADYAIDMCGLELAADGQPIPDDDELRTALAGFIQDNFAAEPWASRVSFDFDLDGADIETIEVQFAGAPSEENVLDACAAVSVFLYELRTGNGDVRVVHDGKAVARRRGPGDECRTR